MLKEKVLPTIVGFVGIAIVIGFCILVDSNIIFTAILSILGAALVVCTIGFAYGSGKLIIEIITGIKENIEFRKSMKKTKEK